MEKKTGLVHIYCGDGKGKTSAAAGLAIRAAGYGHRVLIVQFLKSGGSSEMNVLKNIDNITVVQGCCVSKFVYMMTDSEKLECRNKQDRVFEDAVRLACDEEYDVLVLDEVLDAVNSGTLDYKLLAEFLQNRRNKTEVVMTGRNPDEKLVELADYVTEMKKVKHPYDKGVSARMGIEG